MLLVSVPRLESMWNEELKRGGKDGPSLTRVLWRFCQTRMLVAIFALLLTMVAGFVGPVSTPLSLLLLCGLPIGGRSVAGSNPESDGIFNRISSACFTPVWKLKRKCSEDLITKPRQGSPQQEHRLAGLCPVTLWSQIGRKGFFSARILALCSNLPNRTKERSN